MVKQKRYIFVEWKKTDWSFHCGAPTCQSWNVHNRVRREVCVLRARNTRHCTLNLIVFTKLLEILFPHFWRSDHANSSLSKSLNKAAELHRCRVINFSYRIQILWEKMGFSFANNITFLITYFDHIYSLNFVLFWFLTEKALNSIEVSESIT